MRLEIPISSRARQFGYVIWPISLDQEVSKVLDGADAVDLWLDSSFLGHKNVDWKYRRISLGYRQTRALPPSVKVFVISRRRDGAVQVTCK